MSAGGMIAQAGIRQIPPLGTLAEAIDDHRLVAATHKRRL